MIGFAVSSPSSRIGARSTPFARDNGMPSLRAACAAIAASRAAGSAFLVLTSFSMRGIAFSRVCRSASASSVVIVSRSDAASTAPATWTTSGSSNPRTTWAIAWLNEGKPLSSSTKIDLSLLAELGLLTVKPFIYVFNVDEALLGDQARLDALAALVAPAKAVFLDAKLESELVDLDPEDAAELLASTGQDESGLDQLARIGFDTLGLQTYLTAGPKETRAWTIPKGAKAPQAAGVIHTDFEKGFIKAEIIGFDDLVETGSIAEARAKGKARIEGKEYVMQDGDVVEFRFNN